MSNTAHKLAPRYLDDELVAWSRRGDVTPTHRISDLTLRSTLCGVAIPVHVRMALLNSTLSVVSPSVVAVDPDLCPMCPACEDRFAAFDF